MTEREQDNLLRKALQRVEPPDGFADRVLAKLPDRSLEKQRAPRTRSANVGDALYTYDQCWQLVSGELPIG